MNEPMINKSIDELIDIYVELILGSSDGHLVRLRDDEDELEKQVHRFTKYISDKKNLLEEVKKRAYQLQRNDLGKSILISEIRDIKLNKII